MVCFTLALPLLDGWLLVYLLSPMTMHSLDLLPSLNLQIVSTSWIPLQTFQRTHKRLCTLLLHLPLVLLPLRKLLTPSHSLSRWMLRSLLRSSGSWIQSLQRSPGPTLIMSSVKRNSSPRKKGSTRYRIITLSLCYP